MTAPVDAHDRLRGTGSRNAGDLAGSAAWPNSTGAAYPRRPLGLVHATQPAPYRAIADPAAKWLASPRVRNGILTLIIINAVIATSLFGADLPGWAREHVEADLHGGVRALRGEIAELRVLLRQPRPYSN